MEKIILNNDWFFKRDEVALTAIDLSSFTKINVPHTWNNIDGQDGGNDFYRTNATYVKTFNYVKSDKLTFVEFEGVNSIANVYLNGIHLGEHKGGYSTFRFLLTPHLKEGENILVVYADNRHYDDVYPLMADFTFFGGIYRNVSLLTVDKTHFDLMYYGGPGVYVSQKKITNADALIGIDAYVISDVTKPLTLKVNVKDRDGKVVASIETTKVVSAKEQVSLDLNVVKPHLWQGVEDPYLYMVEVLLLAGDVVLDSRLIPTGLRYFNVDHETFYLNGVKTRLNGVSRHQDRENYGNALTDAMHKEDMDLIVELGANSIRLAHYQQAEYFYHLCDENGMVVWAEIPYISLTSKSDTEGTNALLQMKELIFQNYNHSSIVMWGISNEITIGGVENNVLGILHKLNNLTKKLDPYRYTTMAHLSMVEPSDEQVTLSDIGAFNHYFGWYMGKTGDFKDWIEGYRAAQPKHALGISEYGVEGIHTYHSEQGKIRDYSEEYHALWHEEVYKIFEETPFIWGTYIWNMFAFASDMRDEGGVKGRNNKGLVTFDRKLKKDAFYFYKAKWSKAGVLHINSKRFMIRNAKEIMVKAYSNVGPVSFFINGKTVATSRADGVIYEAKVKLKYGQNTVTVKAGDLTDTAVFKRRLMKHKGYVMPKGGDKGVLNLDVAKNWFEDFNEEKNPIIIDPAFYSVDDKLGLLLKNEATLAVLDAGLPGFRKHPMIGLAKGFTLRAIKELAGDSLPYSAFYNLNTELQKIRK